MLLRSYCAAFDERAEANDKSNIIIAQPAD